MAAKIHMPHVSPSAQLDLVKLYVTAALKFADALETGNLHVIADRVECVEKVRALAEREHRLAELERAWVPYPEQLTRPAVERYRAAVKALSSANDQPNDDQHQEGEE